MPAGRPLMGRHAAPVPPDLVGGVSTGALHLALHAWSGGDADAAPAPVEPRVDTGALQQAVQAWSGAVQPAAPAAGRTPAAPTTAPTTGRTAATNGSRRLPTAPLPTGQVPLPQVPAARPEPPRPEPPRQVVPVAAPDPDDEVLAGQVPDQPFAPRGARGTPAAAPSPMRAPSVAAPGLDTGPTDVVARRPEPAAREARPEQEAPRAGIRAWWSDRRSRSR